MGINYRSTTVKQGAENQGMACLPEYGLARIQWEGPWTADGVPVAARYRHTHWIAVSSCGTDWTTPGWEEPYVFDINAMCAGGWIPYSEWANQLVPWLLKQCEPKSNGKWHVTHAVHIPRPTTPPATGMEREGR